MQTSLLLVQEKAKREKVRVKLHLASFCPSTVQLVRVKITGVNRMKANKNKNPFIFVCKPQVLSLDSKPFPQSSKVKIATSNFKQQNKTEYVKGYFFPSLSVLSQPRSLGWLWCSSAT